VADAEALPCARATVRVYLNPTGSQPDTSKNSDFGSLRHDLTVPARLTVVFPGVFALA